MNKYIQYVTTFYIIALQHPPHTIVHTSLDSTPRPPPVLLRASRRVDVPRASPASLTCWVGRIRASSMPTVSLLDYGAGNVRSVRNAIAKVGLTSGVETAEDAEAASCIVFPGVGRFGECMDFLNSKKWTDALKAYIATDRPFLGICVGFQALFESSDESPGIEGLVLCLALSLDSAPRLLACPCRTWDGTSCDSRKMQSPPRARI